MLHMLFCTNSMIIDSDGLHDDDSTQDHYLDRPTEQLGQGAHQ